MQDHGFNASKGNRYTDNEKHQLVYNIANHPSSVLEACSIYGINEKSYYRWRAEGFGNSKEFLKGVGQEGITHSVVTDDGELKNFSPATFESSFEKPEKRFDSLSFDSPALHDAECDSEQDLEKLSQNLIKENELLWKLIDVLKEKQK